MFLLKIAVRPWRITPMSQILAVASVAFLLFLAGVMGWLALELYPVLERLNGEQVVTAYLSPEVGKEGSREILDTVRLQLGAAPYREFQVRLVDQNEFLENLSAHYPELKNDLKTLGEDLDLVVPRYITVSGVLPSYALERIKSISGISLAESSKNRFRHIVQAFSTFQFLIWGLGGGIVFALFAGLVHLSRMNSYLHSDTLELIRLWGADALTLRLPTSISGLIVGASGGLIAAFAWIAASEPLGQRVRVLSPILDGIHSPPLLFGPLLVVLGTLVGAGSGLFGFVRKT